MSDHVTLGDRIKTLPQFLLPQQALTRLANRISNSKRLARPMIALIRRLFAIELDDYQMPDGGFATFDAFFTRALRPGARRFPDDPAAIACPSDGRISQIGAVTGGSLLQAKGRSFRLHELLADRDWAERLDGGRFVTVYLAPSDYHRVHVPVSGRLLREWRVPGKLFSVSEATTRTVDRLFARNERMVALFETTHGPVAVVMVAAMLVAGIETTWDTNGPTRPGRTVSKRDFDPQPELVRGDELGRFHWGSTVIVVTPPGAPAWRPELSAGAVVRLGQPLT
ncbi:MAG: archaetidylserine decarboxylase [Wenzhouxiangellaceae bacterium]|nr:archaetidylserine decarboxylase [Wenzhouxiangellaceae bacterium]